MSAPSQVYLITPGDVIIYSFSNTSTGLDVAYNAGTLEKIENLPIEDVKEVKGLVTSRFGVNPTILAYDDNKYEVVYGLDDKVVYGDGSLVMSNGSKVVAETTISIPDMTESMSPILLASPNKTSIQEYIDMTHREKSGQTPARPAESPSVPVEIEEQREVGGASGQTPVRPEQSPSVPTAVFDERFTTLQKQDDDRKREVEELKADVEDLKQILEALTRRIYQLYPVKIPHAIRDGKSLQPIVPFEDIVTKMNEGKIEKHELNPLLQPYAGSHRSNNRLVTFIEKDGGVCHVRVDYDQQNGNINPPKYA